MNYMSLNFETGIFWVSILRPGPRLKLFESHIQDRIWDWNFPGLDIETKSENGIIWVSISRMGLRLMNWLRPRSRPRLWVYFLEIFVKIGAFQHFFVFFMRNKLGLSNAKLSKVIFGCPEIIFEVVFAMILR